MCVLLFFETTQAEFFKKSASEEAARRKDLIEEHKAKEKQLQEQLALASEKASESVKQQLHIAQRKAQLLEEDIEERERKAEEEKREIEEMHAAQILHRDEQARCEGSRMSEASGGGEGRLNPPACVVPRLRRTPRH